MAKSDQPALAVVGGIIGVGALAYVGCRLHDDWHIQQGRGDRCVLPAIQAMLQAAVDRLFRPIPVPVQAGIEYVLGSADLYEPYGGAYSLGLPCECSGGEFGWQRDT